jgi:iron complex transport system permease protein
MNSQSGWVIRLLLPTLTLVFLLLNIGLGSVSIPYSDIVSILFGDEVKSSWHQIIWQFRVPKAITALLVGIGLSVGGLQMQTLFRNPLAGPFVLGISSGASLGVALVIFSFSILGISLSQFTGGSWLMIIAATGGASLVLIVVLLAAQRVKDSMSLLIIGLMFGSITGALVSVMQFFSSDEQIQMFLIWTFGSLGGLSWTELYVLASIIIVGLLLNLFLLKPLNALLLGEHYANSMGINLKLTRWLIIISTSLLAGSITAFCGPIAFVGLAVPHLGRLLMNTSNHTRLLPAVIWIGAIVMLICDIIAQLPGNEQVLPINAMTSLVGAPVVIWIIVRKRKINNQLG